MSTFAEPSSREDLDRFWERQQAYWHLFFALVWITALFVTVADDHGPRGLWPEVGCMVGVGLAYVLLGWRGLLEPDQARARAYLLIVWTLVILTQWLNPGTETWILYFILYPQLWAMLRTAHAIALTIVVTVGVGVLRLAQSTREPEELAAIGVGAAMSLTLSLALGLFISAIIREANARAVTIDQLCAAQEQLAAAERDRGVLAERERLSREIHDTLAQGFTSVLTLARAANAALGRGDALTAAARLDLIERTAVDNLSEARLMVAELTPGHLESRSLIEALGRLCATVRSESGLDVRLQVEGEPSSLGGAGEVVLFRAAQEALANVRKHAAATRAEVTVAYAQDVGLTVTDNGHGFDPTTVSGGFGLDGMRARAGALDGAVAVDASPGQGTRVSVTLPVNRPVESSGKSR
ncbi:MAG: sensor histidine kinase [Tetrasphaera sp.]